LEAPTGQDQPARPAPPPDPAHRDDGLDLARALTRATAGSTPKARRRPRRRDRPVPGRVSGSHPDERDPQLLDTTLGRLVDDHGWELDLRVHGVFGRWPELVGAEVAAHCTPESFADGKLLVRTDSTAWATQLKLLAPTVVRRLNEELGHGTVALIEVVGPHLPSWKKGPRSVRDGRGPRDTYG
jgi:predicted nucleic acid-binding Zn ribbon protein